MKKIYSLIFLLLIIFSIVAPSYADGKILLRLNLEKGKTYLYRTTTNQTITQTINGRKFNINQLIGMDIIYEVQDVDQKGITTIKATYTAIRFFQEGPTGKVEYDSDNTSGEVPLPAQGMAALIGQCLTVRMSPANKLVEVNGVDRIIDKITGNLDENLQATAIKENIKSMFGDKALQRMFEGEAFFPERPVGPGDVWTQKVALTQGFPMFIAEVFKFKEHQNGIAIIETNAQITANDTNPIDFGNFSMKYSLNGSISGVIEIDEKTGFILKSTMLFNVSGIMTVNGAGDPDFKISVPMTIERIATTETTEITN